MRIQYGDMNPYRELPQSVATGLGLGMQYNKMQAEKGNVPNIPFSNPGARPQIDPNKAFGAEEQDISTINDFWKKSKTLSPEDQQAIYSELETKVLKTDLGKNTARAVMTGQMKLDDAANLLKKVKSGTATDADIALFKGQLKAAGINPQIVDKKMNEMQSAQNQMNYEYELGVKSTLNGVLQFYQDPNQFAYKGQVSEEVKTALDNEKNYLAELAKNPDNAKWLDDYVKARGEILKSKAGAAGKGFQPAYDEYNRAMKFNKDTGEMEYIIDPQTKEPYVMRDELTQAGIMGALISGQKEKVGQKFSEPPPRNKKAVPKLKPLTQADYDRFMKEAKGDSNVARKLAKQAGHDTSKIVK